MYLKRGRWGIREVYILREQRMGDWVSIIENLFMNVW